MAFLKLFPNGKCDWLEPCLQKVYLHEYVKHIIQYRDHRSGRHPQFSYYMENMIMRHRAQNSNSVFVKRNIEEFPMTMDELHEHMENFSGTHLAHKLMHFGTTLRGTRSYWKKGRAELYDLLKQLGIPIIFFTLTAADLYWTDLHAFMLRAQPLDPREAQKGRIQNVINYLHIVVHYMHLKHTMFRK